MISYFLKMGIRQFAKRYNYDTGYMFHVVDTATEAGIRLSLVPIYSQFQGAKEALNLWADAMLGSTREGDCGPCVCNQSFIWHLQWRFQRSNSHFVFRAMQPQLAMMGLGFGSLRPLLRTPLSWKNFAVKLKNSLAHPLS
ncbi:MAG: hypothetical protein ABJH45_12335 [Paracoccaceae bacterium]